MPGVQALRRVCVEWSSVAVRLWEKVLFAFRSGVVMATGMWGAEMASGRLARCFLVFLVSEGC